MTCRGYIERAGIAPGTLLASIKEVDVSNGFMLEVFSGEPGVIPDIAKLWSVRESTLTSKLARLRARHKSMKKSIGRPGTREKIASFLDEPFSIPASSTPPNPSSVYEEKHQSDQCGNCKRLLQVCDEEKADHRERMQHLRERYEASNELLQTKLSKMRRKVRELNKIIGSGTKDLHRKYRRADNRCVYWKGKFKIATAEVTKLTKAKEKARKRAERYRQKFWWLKKKQQQPNVRPKVLTRFTQKDEDFIRLMDKIDELESEISQLKAPVPTKEGRHYNTAIREASFYLQDIGVPEHKTSEAIKTVTETIHRKQIGPLPSSSTQNRMGSEMKALSRVHIRESLQEKDKLTLKYDGTTKGRLGHLAEVELATKHKTFMVGFSKQVGGSAGEYVSSIEEACNAISPDTLSDVANTMTDRCVTNQSVDKKLEEQRNISLNKFRCAMHPLDTFEKEANKALKKMDVVPDRSCEMPCNKGGECNAQAFIRVGSKIFCSNSCGDSTDLRNFLKERGHDRVMQRWVGNRFNILFSSAGTLYSIGESVVEYFKTVNKPTNDLHRAFVNAWNKPNICHLRCLGLVGCLISRPWMEAVSKEGNILEMNDLYMAAVEMLEKWIEDPSSMLTDGCTIFRKDPARDAILDSLLSKPFEDDMLDPLKAVLMAILEVVRRQLTSQLPGGHFWEASEVVKEQAASCVSNNISGERNFARLDAHLHHAPNITIGKIESKVMFRANDTGVWLKSKPYARRKSLICTAIREGKSERKKEKEKKKKHLEKVQQRVREKQQKLSEKAEQERNKKN